MRVRLSNHSLNSYGFWVLTSGISLERYNQNPVLLYMHQRGEVIGTVEDIKVEGEELTGELKFDEASELSKRAKKQFECGSLRMVSIGFTIVETSEDDTMLVQGQTRPTVTKCELFEVSAVDIGANPDAVRLYGRDGQLITLSDGGESPLPLLNNKFKREKNMEFLCEEGKKKYEKEFDFLKKNARKNNDECRWNIYKCTIWIFSNII